ncbi:ABC-three component system middle component 6 [Serratia quinivorans]|uniref:ABC-three component system middle component 6 n=1 Tax=Serratia quinivorans TaxID=137545 RepID=UPI0036F1CF6C
MINNVQYPKKSLYIIGANVIKIISCNLQSSISIVKLYDDYERDFESVSYPYFIYALDWLFIIGFIKLNENGDLEICN